MMPISAVFTLEFTPTQIFLSLIFLVGTITLSSIDWGSQSPDKEGDDHLKRSQPSSVFDRVRSFKLNRQYYQYKSEEELQVEEDNPTALLLRQPSLTERLISNFNFGHHPAVVQEKEYQGDKRPPPQLSRRPSFLDRLKSINPYGDAEETGSKVENDLNRTHSEPSPLIRKAAPAKKNKKKLTKSFSERCKSAETPEEVEAKFFRQPASTRGVERKPLWKVEDGDGDEDEETKVKEVEAKSDDFINRFRQQLKLERLASILNRSEKQ